MSENTPTDGRWFVDEDGNLVWPLDKEPEAIYLNAAVFEVHHSAPGREARGAFAALRDLVDRGRVLEVIRQRVSAGWVPLRCEPPIEPRWSRCDMDPEPISPSVAGVLWPDEETQ